ncbi:GNAT family N-acetyltransferase [Rhizomicrobium electricum]|jgi:RimJ/RimL family protein N-acetyltransferase|uniref:N-acetyltransferase domain-containing protein n=1 Tax=Rhizomicrobium electricum TaxID=480070 RepID=A0ABN1E0R5_9PROT|nr:GNAT family N-acetyltransferase [Rhizomicrobium electricum]NIJ47363.1 RimJ/RimL family protein N-acetyltransferase [Rhizomicrobium electricum]
MTSIYPSHLVREVLWQGERLLVRPVRKDDTDGYIAAAKLCTIEDIRRRLMTGIMQVSQALIAKFTEVDYDRTMAFVAEGVKGDLMAITRLVHDSCRKSAEFAIIVRSDLQRKGLGMLMQKMLLDYAHDVGLHEVWGMVDCENRKILSLVEKLGFTRRLEFGNPFARVVKVLG